jgi:hypothetical protein
VSVVGEIVAWHVSQDCSCAVHLTSVGILLPGYQEFQIAPSKTIVGQAEKNRSLPCLAHGSAMIIGRDIFGHILLNKKHIYSTPCHFSFEILHSLPAMVLHEGPLLN